MPIDFSDVQLQIAFLAAVGSLVVAVVTHFSQRATAKRQAASQRELESELELLKDDLERSRSFDVASREQALTRLESLRVGLVEVSGFASLVVKRSWIYQDGALASAEQGMTRALEGVHLDLALLGATGVFTASHVEEAQLKQAMVVHSWNATIGEATRREPSFTQEFPDATPYSGVRLQEYWNELKHDVSDLTTAIVHAISNAAIPH